MRPVDADALSKSIQDGPGTEMQKFFADVCVSTAPTLDVAPIDELITLRDDLYESDRITMKGLAQLNALIAKYKSLV